MAEFRSTRKPEFVSITALFIPYFFPFDAKPRRKKAPWKTRISRKLAGYVHIDLNGAAFLAIFSKPAFWGTTRNVENSGKGSMPPPIDSSIVAVNLCVSFKHGDV